MDWISRKVRPRETVKSSRASDVDSPCGDGAFGDFNGSLGEQTGNPGVHIPKQKVQAKGDARMWPKK
jgi:hypothetical protein